MGKLRGFLEHQRLNKKIFKSKKELKIIKNLQLLRMKKNFKIKGPDVWTVEFHFATVGVR